MPLSKVRNRERMRLSKWEVGWGTGWGLYGVTPSILCKNKKVIISHNQ